MLKKWDSKESELSSKITWANARHSLLASLTSRVSIPWKPILLNKWRRICRTRCRSSWKSRIRTLQFFLAIRNYLALHSYKKWQNKWMLALMWHASQTSIFHLMKSKIDVHEFSSLYLPCLWIHLTVLNLPLRTS